MFFFGKQIGKKKVSHFEDLKEKWTQKHKELQENLWQKHGKILSEFSEKSKQFAVGSLAGVLMLTSSGSALSTSIPQTVKEKPFKDLDSASSLLLDLQPYIPQEVRPLTPDEEEKIGQILSRAFGMRISATLDGKRLNRSYGIIGAEQHLARYPGDNMDTHFTSGEDTLRYYDSGMASGLGAWGYFAKSAAQLTEEDILREEYYIAVPTFLTEGYNQHVAEYSKFFQYRKMLVVNPQNGKAIVADIADSGPAEWTGKHLGGSPEVMKYLERVDGAQRGPVLYFFIDESQNKIPLGPVEL